MADLGTITKQDQQRASCQFKVENGISYLNMAWQCVAQLFLLLADTEMNYPFNFLKAYSFELIFKAPY